jgi:outer membrane protein
MGRWAMAALAVLVVAGVAARPGEHQQATARIGIVSTDLVLRQMSGFAAAESTFNAEMQSYQQEVRRLQAQLDSAQSSFDQQSLVLSPTAREEKVKELQSLQNRFVQRSQEIQERAQGRQSELMAPLEERAQRVIDGLRAERNLWVIFDVSQPTNQIVSADPGLDLTQVVISRLRGAGPGDE